MRELSLFSGAGGGLLATVHLLGWHSVGYVECNDYCQRVLAQRIKDGYLPEAPIFGDIKTFNRIGYAKAYKGMVDIITGGFPCQPFSVAGNQKGADDERNMWPETIKTIRSIRPPFAFLENVPGILSRKHKYFETIVSDLAESGYDVRWKVISAAEVGAPHRRNRLWIVANSQSVHGTCSKEKKRVRVCKPGGFESPSKTRSLLGRKYDGMDTDMDRLEALGNGQVPAVVKVAWELLTG